MNSKRAVVLLSGGLDSATCMYLAREQGFDVLALSFNYEQRHKVELTAARRLAESCGASHTVIDVNLRAIGASALTDDVAVPKGGGHLQGQPSIPATYVPVRNLIFLSLAYALAEARECSAIFTGVNAIDYSGYPDCRPDFIASFSQTAALASKVGREGLGPQILTPLIALTKMGIATEAMRLNVPIHLTWSCYDPQEKEGVLYPCESCDACLLRKDGFSSMQHQLPNGAIFGSPVKLA
jgi:7-cyano-7-deazaguanine synthase